MKNVLLSKNKTVVVLCCLLTLAFGTSYGQSSYHKGDNVINVSIGVGTPYWGALSASVSPGASYEYGLTDEISVGAGFSHSSAKDKLYGIKYSGTSIGLRGSYHFELSEKLDPYVGVTLGYINVSVTSDELYLDNFSVGSGLGYGAYAGLRYFPSSNIGVHAELGYTSLSILNVGASFKF